MWVSRWTTNDSVIENLVGRWHDADICQREDLPSAVDDNDAPLPHDRPMKLCSTLAWLVDAAGASPGADWFLPELGAQLIGDDLPLAGGALTFAVPHPIMARRTWLWRAENGVVIEAVGFASAGFAGAGQQDSYGDARRRCGRTRGRAVHEDVVGAG